MLNSAAAENFMKTHEEVVENLRKKSVELADLSHYIEIKDNIKKVVGNLFPYSNIEIHFFGSRIIGVGSDDSDLDIFVDIDGKFKSNFFNNRDSDNRFNKVASALRSNRDWMVVKEVLRTRVPVIICEYLPMKLKCKNIHSICSFIIINTNFNR